jgi:hypothetical protein
MTSLVERNISYVCADLIGEWKDTQNGGGIQSTNKSAGMPHRAYINIEEYKKENYPKVQKIFPKK